MDNPVAMAYLVQAFACNARIAAMQAHNQHRLSIDNSIAYDEDAFLYEAQVLEGISEALLRI